MMWPFYGSAQWTGLINEEDVSATSEVASFDLNTTDEYTLRQLSHLSDRQIADILEYRSKLGHFLSPYELQSIRSLTIEDIKNLLLIFHVSLAEAYDQVLEPNNFVLFRAKYEPQARSGFLKTDNGFQGDRGYYMVRAQYKRRKRWMVALTTEKDAGERWLWNPEKGNIGFDHYAGYIQWQHTSGLQVLAGNYRIHFGQGLICGSGFSLGKGSEPVTSLRGPRSGILGYRALGERIALRGITASIRKKSISLGLFLSYAPRDARLYEADSNAYFQGFQRNGNHRTASEGNTAKTITQSTAGIYLEKQLNTHLSTGMIYRLDILNFPMMRNDSWYDYFSWQGNTHQNIGWALQFQQKNYYGWLELAWSDYEKVAFQAGLLLQVGRRWSTSLLFRKYDTGYFAFDAQAFGEKSGIPVNEQGIYWGLSFTPKKKWKISGYVDVFQFPWLTFSTSSPVYGREYLLNTTWTVAKDLDISLHYRNEQKHDNLPAELSVIRKPGLRIVQQTDTYVRKKISRWLEWRFRVRWKQASMNEDKVSGIGGFQEIILRHRKGSVSYRYTIFESEDYDARIYFHERDAWGSFSLPALSGTGVRQYILLQYKVGRNIDFWLRFAQTKFQKRKETTGNHDEIPGDLRSLLTCQLRIKI